MRILSYSLAAALLIAFSFLLGGAVEEYINDHEPPRIVSLVAFGEQCTGRTRHVFLTYDDGTVLAIDPMQMPEPTPEIQAQLDALTPDQRILVIVPCFTPQGNNNEQIANHTYARGHNA